MDVAVNTESDASGDGDVDVSLDASADGGCKWRKEFEVLPSEVFPEDSYSSLFDIWGSSSSDVYAVGNCHSGPIDEGYSCIFHYDGDSWTEMEYLELHVGGVGSIWGSSKDNIFAAGGDVGNFITRYDGNEWSIIYEPQMSPRDLWGNSASDMFVVGNVSTGIPGTPQYGIVLHYDGNEWSNIYREKDTSLNGVWSSSDSGVYVIVRFSKEDSAHCKIIRYDGQDWKEVKAGTNDRITDIWGSSATAVFILILKYDSSSEFINSSIWHYDRKSWSEMETNIPEELRDIRGSSSNDVYAVGKDAIYHYDGDSWSKMEMDEPWDLWAVWAPDKDEAFAVGGPWVLHYSCE